MPFSPRSANATSLRFASRCRSLASAFMLTALAACGQDSATEPRAETRAIAPSNALAVNAAGGGAGRRSYQVGSVVFLENSLGKDVARIGIDLKWGGAIIEGSLNGDNFVNAHDAARAVQVAFYDGSQSYHQNPDDSWSSAWGWNPVQAGDAHGGGSTVLSYSVSDTAIYVRTQMNHWYPDNRGGGVGMAVPGDVLLEQWITAVTQNSKAFRVRYRLTHTGSDEHALAAQEMPAVYTNQEYGRLIAYTGASPWTNGATTQVPLPDRRLPQRLGRVSVTERWASLVDSRNIGLTVYAPRAYPWTHTGVSASGLGGANGDGTNYFAFFTPTVVTPKGVYDADYYVIMGDQDNARRAVYTMRASIDANDALSPWGFVDSPARDAQITGFVNVTGWAMDNDAIKQITVMIDGKAVGIATRGIERLDVLNDWKNAAKNLGYTYRLDTRLIPAGRHQLSVRAVDLSGNEVTLLGSRDVIVVQ